MTISCVLLVVGALLALGLAGWLWVYVAARLVFRAKWRTLKEEEFSE